MTHSIAPHSIAPSPTMRKEWHITDLFFRSELVQLVGSDDGDRWFRNQSGDVALNRTTPRSNPDACSHRPAETDSPKSECKLPNQDMPNPASLSMDDSNLLYLLGSNMFSTCQNCEDDIGLLFTDAAHTVLSRLGSQTAR